MRLRDFFHSDRHALSLEVFPPVRDGNVDELFSTIDELAILDPDYISVTYGAGGTSQDMTVEIASHIKNIDKIEVMAHLTCVQATRDDIARVLREFASHNIENILALRGDPPAGSDHFTQTEGGFAYANELVDYIHQKGDFSVGVAGYPECHTEASDINTDIANLKRKVDAGAECIVTQLFFDNEDFYRFRDKALGIGITVPILPGIFPITRYQQITKIASLCGARIPNALLEKIHAAHVAGADISPYGIDYAIWQSIDLLTHGVPGLHFYSMNKSAHVIDVIRELPLQRGVNNDHSEGIARGQLHASF